MEPVVTRFTYDIVSNSAIWPQYIINWFSRTLRMVTHAGATDSEHTTHPPVLGSQSCVTPAVYGMHVVRAAQLDLHSLLTAVLLICWNGNRLQTLNSTRCTHFLCLYSMFLLDM